MIRKSFEQDHTNGQKHWGVFALNADEIWYIAGIEIRSVNTLKEMIFPASKDGNITMYWHFSLREFS